MRTLSIIASVVLVGCAAGSEPDGDLVRSPAPALGGGSPTQSAPDKLAQFAHGDDAEVAPRADSPISCRQGAFCETFETPAYATRWTGVFTNGRGTIELGQDSASFGVGSLRLTSLDEASSAYLHYEKGEIGAQWAGSLSFAIRFPELPRSYVGGPELTVKTEAGSVSLRVALTPDGLILEQDAAGSCPADRCAGTRTPIARAVPNHWYHVVVGLEVNARAASSYGIVETSVDGSDFVANKLTVPLAEGSISLNAGITEGDSGRSFAADLDDVSMLVR